MDIFLKRIQVLIPEYKLGIGQPMCDETTFDVTYPLIVNSKITRIRVNNEPMDMWPGDYIDEVAQVLKEQIIKELEFTKNQN